MDHNEIYGEDRGTWRDAVEFVGAIIIIIGFWGFFIWLAPLLTNPIN